MFRSLPSSYRESNFCAGMASNLLWDTDHGLLWGKLLCVRHLRPVKLVIVRVLTRRIYWLTTAIH